MLSQRSFNLRQPLTGHPVETQIIEKMIRRYGINYVASRAVTLFDIVGFSLLTPFEQMTQLNSLSYSLNSAHAKMLEQDVGINFARSSSGDGFYVWNRDDGLEANVNLYHFMHIVLADNAIARSKSTSKAVPRLRACFHVGACYEFHQAEGLNPTMHDFIVGDVTIELARMIDAALPGQILVGDFLADITDEYVDPAQTQANLDAVTFLQRAQGNLAKLSGMEFSGERVTAIKCYLTGEDMGGGQFNIRRLHIKDKHGLSRVAYNAKVNIYRETAQPILLGIEDRKLMPRRSLASHVADWRTTRDLAMKLVGARGFEPPTPTTPLWCATRLRYAPTEFQTNAEGGNDTCRFAEKKADYQRRSIFRTCSSSSRNCLIIC